MKFFSILPATFKAWSEDKASRLGAALAYYAIFSIGPVLVVMLAVAGFVLGGAANQGQVLSSVEPVLGADNAKFIQTLVQSASKPTTGIVATVIGVITLLMGAAAIFGQLKDALDTVWEVTPSKGGGIAGAVVQNLLRFAMVLVAGLLLLASLVVNAVLSAVGPLISNNLPGGALLWAVVNYVATLAIIALVFALIYKFLPDVQIGWREVLIGGAVTAVLFVLGQIALGLYLSLAHVGSAFGAAASLVVVLVWIYYSAQIFLFGAEFTQVYANRYGTPPVPKEGAEFATQEARAQQGIASKTREPRKKQGEQKAPGQPRLRVSPWFR